jgi:hypothetical protein
MKNIFILFVTAIFLTVSCDFDGGSYTKNKNLRRLGPVRLSLLRLPFFY